MPVMDHEAYDYEWLEKQQHKQIGKSAEVTSAG
jgi:hypothetical protein